MIFNKKDRLNNLIPDKRTNFFFRCHRNKKHNCTFYFYQEIRKWNWALNYIACVRIPKRHHKFPLNTVIEKTDIETQEEILIDQFKAVDMFLQSYEIMQHSVRFHFYSSPVKPYPKPENSFLAKEGWKCYKLLMFTSNG